MNTPYYIAKEIQYLALAAAVDTTYDHTIIMGIGTFIKYLWFYGNVDNAALNLKDSTVLTCPFKVRWSKWNHLNVKKVKFPLDKVD